MRRFVGLVFTLLLLGSIAFAQAQPTGPRTVSMVLDRSVAGVEGEFVPLVEAMPEAKFDFAPTNGEFKGVRNFNEMTRHVAAVNYMIGAAILGEKPPVDLGKGENGPDLKTKAEVVKFAKDSFAYLHKAVSSVNEKNQVELIDGPWGGKATRLGLSVLVVGHIFDHYGQLVEYGRMNGIIPPASRQK